jgi:hypothetical protein
LKALLENNHLLAGFDVVICATHPPSSSALQAILQTQEVLQRGQDWLIPCPVWNLLKGALSCSEAELSAEQLPQHREHGALWWLSSGAAGTASSPHLQILIQM